jgi:hypothetical protein
MIEVEKENQKYRTIWVIKGTRIIHRDDGPAVEFLNGEKRWYQHGVVHRDGGPAIEYANGDEAWYRNGKLHRKDGPARTFNIINKIEWHINGELHRDDGPAIEYQDSKSWYKFGVLHRDDGPAFINGKEISWWFNGELCKKEKWLELIPEDRKVKALYSEYFIRD